MKLHAHHVAAFNRRSEWFDVMRDGRGVGCDGSLVGVRKVDVFARIDAGEKTRIRADFKRIPTNVRNFFNTFLEARTRFGKMSESQLRGRFARPRVEPLHSYANAEKRNVARNRRANRGRNSSRVKPLGSGKMTHSRQHNALGCFDKSDVAVGHFSFSAQMAQRFEHRGEIAGFVINHRYAHQRSPFVEGSIFPNCLSCEQATRSARAKALNMASILW